MNPPGWRQPLTWALAALVALPALAAAAAAVSRTWAPVSDWALIELRLRDVGTIDTPLLGPFSRYGWNHPGPLMFWLLAPLYRLFGGAAGGMDAAAAVVTGTAAAGMVFVARRVGGRQLAVIVAFAGCLLLGAAGSTVADPWNPWLAVVPFALFLVAAAGVASGDPVLLPVAVGAGSFLVQTHVGYGALVGAIGAWSVGWLVLGLMRAHRRGAPSIDRRRLLMITGASALIALVAWSGPLLEQATRDPGNIRAIATYFASGDRPTADVQEVSTVVGRQLHPVPPWLGGVEPTNLFTAALERVNPLWALPSLLALTAATVVGWRRRDVLALHLAGVTWVGLAIGTVAVTRITGEVYFYLVRYWWVLAMFVWVTTAWVIARAVLDRLTVTRQVLVVGSIIVVALASVGALPRTMEARPVDPTSVAMAAMADDIVASVEPGATYRVEATGFSWYEVLFGVVDALDDAGVRAVADRTLIYQLGERRVVGGPGVPATVAGTLIVASGDAVDDAGRDPLLERVAVHDPFSPRDRARLNTLKARITAEVRESGRDDLLESVTTGGLVYLLTAEPALAARLGIDINEASELTILMTRDARVAVFLDRSGTSAAGRTAAGGGSAGS
jgi:hypothetical protein